MKKISITTTSFGKADGEVLNPLKERGFEIIFNTRGRKLEAEEVKDIAKDSIGIIAGTESMNEDVLSSLKNLKVISRCGTGLDNVDLKASQKLGIKVFNTPDAPTLAVAELTVGLMLNLLRKVQQMDGGIREGKWRKLMGNLLNEKQIGIIGLGRIGRKVAELLLSFGCVIRYYDVMSDKQDERIKRVDLDELLRISDIISIHVSSSARIIGEQEIGRMKKGAWIVNVSRGGVLDERALCRALENGYLSGAALDVFEEEPYMGELRKLDNVILTPHIGSYAEEARIRMEKQAVENLLKGLEEQ